MPLILQHQQKGHQPAKQMAKPVLLKAQKKNLHPINVTEVLKELNVPVEKKEQKQAEKPQAIFEEMECQEQTNNSFFIFDEDFKSLEEKTGEGE